MTIYPCGSEVVIKRPGVFGNVTAVMIRFELITYEITYYVDSIQQRVWVHEDEIMKDGKKHPIGFKK
jgi:hypothetical protein